MKRYQFTNVTSPSVELAVGGQVYQTKVIRNTNKNPNFDDPIHFFDIVRLVWEVSLFFNCYEYIFSLNIILLIFIIKLIVN